MYNFEYSILNLFLFFALFFTADVKGMFLGSRQTLSSNLEKIRVYLFFILFVFNAIFSYYLSDTFHYIKYFESGYFDIYEPFYNWLALTVAQKNVFVWRGLIFGLALCFVFISAKRLNIVDSRFLPIFLLLNFVYFPLSRASLAYVIATYGLILLLTRKNYFESLFGLAFIFMSFYLHKSSCVYILFMFLSATLGRCYRFDKYLISIVVLAFPFIFVYQDPLLLVLKDILQSEVLSPLPDNLRNKISYFLFDSAPVQWSVWGYLGLGILRAPMLLALVYSVLNFNSRESEVETVYFVLLRVSIYCICLGMLFCCLPVSAFLSERFFIMSLVSLCFVLTRAWCFVSLSNLLGKIFIISAIVQVIFLLLYQIYKY